jgi:hypothetical protein
MLNLAYGLTFADLHSIEGAARIDRAFCAHLAATDPSLGARLDAARQAPELLAARPEADLLLAVAPHLEDFLAALFDIGDAVRALEARHHELAPLFAVKRQFVQRKAMNAFKPDVAATFDGAALRLQLLGMLGEPWSELAYANAVTRWQAHEAEHADQLEIAQRYAAWAAHTPAGRASCRSREPRWPGYRHGRSRSIIRCASVMGLR